MVKENTISKSDIQPFLFKSRLDDFRIFWIFIPLPFLLVVKVLHVLPT